MRNVIPMVLLYGCTAIALKREKRLIGGELAKVGDIPFQVYIKSFAQPLSPPLRCTGSLITRKHILTAGHCVATSQFFIIFFGDVNTTVMEKKLNFVNSSAAAVVSTYQHSYVSANDVGIIKLPNQIEESDHVKVIRLVADDEESLYNTGQIVQASGWGLTSDNNRSLPTDLSIANLSIISPEDCQMYFIKGNDPDIFCIQGINGAIAGPCQGDAGAPVVNNGVLIGHVSYGKKGKCTKGYPVIATKLIKYLDWILHIIGP